MTRILRALPSQFALILPATAILYLVSPLLAEGSVSGSSILIVFSFASILAIAAIGQTLVVQQGGLDLSVPGVISLAAVLVTKFPDGDNSSLAPWIAVALACGFLSGLICGIAITRFRVTALVATLAVNALLYGTVLYLTKGTSTEAVPSMLSSFAVGRIYGIPHLAIFALAFILLIEVGMRATVWGRRFVAVGVNARAARAASLRVTSYKIATYAIAGAFYALSGVLLAGYLRVPSLLVGNSYLLQYVHPRCALECNLQSQARATGERERHAEKRLTIRSKSPPALQAPAWVRPMHLFQVKSAWAHKPGGNT